MTTHPTAHYSVYRLENNQTEQHRLTGVPGYDMLCLYAPQAVAADYVYRTIENTVSLETIKNFLRRAVSRLSGRDSRALELQAEIERTLGVDLPLEAEQVQDMMAEVRKFQWIEAERAGRDIWRERDPRNPEGLALREWFRLHFGSWYLARVRRAANA